MTALTLHVEHHPFLTPRAVGHLAFQCRNDLSRAADAQSAPVMLDIESTSSEESDDLVSPGSKGSSSESSDEGGRPFLTRLPPHALRPG